MADPCMGQPGPSARERAAVSGEPATPGWSGKAWLHVRVLAALLRVRMILWLLPHSVWAPRMAPELFVPAKPAPGPRKEPPTGRGRPGTDSARSVPITPILRAVGRVSPLVPGGTCLVQALAIRQLLERSGVPSVLHIGVAREEPGDLAAHAWLECRGQVVVGGAGAPRYTPLVGSDPGERVP